ncbi:MAG: Ig-like domain-containing protein, partial [Hymenobacteraceae bacterium]|nr:Ig-like domain-containing protein [Hymenobacteraceae bacterium]
QSALVYAATVTPAADGQVLVSVAAGVAVDAATNGNLASNEVSILYDVAKPTVALTTPAADPTNAPFTVTFTFSEPVTGFAQGDISVTNATVSDLTAASTSVYTARVTPTADGEVTVSVAAGVAQDAATNGNEASAILSRIYDATRPTVTLATTAADPTNAPFTATFSFSEEVFGFELGDITVTNGAASEFTKVDGQTYTALVRPASDGDVTVALAAGVASDKATNPSEAAAELRRLYDATAPAGYTVVINTNRVDVTNVSNMSLSVTGAEVGTTYFYTITSENGGTPVTGTAQVQQAAFDLTALNLTSLNDGTLTVTLYLTDEAGNKGANATAEVTKITRDIVAVTALEVIKVPIRTAYANVPMPAQVEVTYSTGAREQLNVTWTQGNYNGLVAGSYELTGELILAPMTTNLTQQIAKVTVEVQPNKVPTALAFSATTFKPEATAEDVIGTLSTTDPDDNTFVYTLVSGAGDANNSLFEVKGDKLYLKSNKGLSGMTAFSIRVRSTDPYSNTIEKSLTLTKELYAKAEDQLKIVNAFSPDGDGINDTWIIPELRFYNNVEIEVFDRSGVRLFRTTNPEEGWDGRGLNGKVLQGAYLYIVQVKDIGMVKKGVVTILKK